MIYFHNNELSIVHYIDNIPQSKADFFSQDLRCWFMRCQAKFNKLSIDNLSNFNKIFLKNQSAKLFIKTIILKLKKKLLNLLKI